ncbi:hypothetical protein J4423_02650 [Candidatus Pacearchaeota archaeon]|nr:hypothetical protein [Candidatus Pacearchaeota archaeon]
MLIEEQFVGIEPLQVNYGEKQLLYCEMEILTSLQKHERYKRYRKEELAIKNLLKKVVFELKKEMEILIEYIPQVKVIPLKAEKVEIAKIIVPPSRRDALEDEIQSIRRKIAILSAS